MPKEMSLFLEGLDKQFVNGKHFRRCPQTVIIDSMPQNWKIGWESVLLEPFSLGAGEGGSYHICILDFSLLAQRKGKQWGWAGCEGGLWGSPIADLQ